MSTRTRVSNVGLDLTGSDDEWYYRVGTPPDQKFIPFGTYGNPIEIESDSEEEETRPRRKNIQPTDEDDTEEAPSPVPLPWSPGTN